MRANATSATITHKEYIADITGSSDFFTSSFSLNPGIAAVFPWLSNIAVNYESYVFKRLEFMFETSVATTTPGTVMLAVDYDATDAAPLTKQALMSYAQAQRSSPWQACSYNCRSGDLTKFAKERYVRSGDTTGDIKTYDVGNLFLSTQGTPATVLGELYVAYTIELRTPQTHTPGTPVGPGILSASYGMSTDFIVPLSTTSLVDYADELFNTAGITNTAGEYSIPAGQWVFTIVMYVSSFAPNPLTILVDGVVLSPSIALVPGLNNTREFTGAFVVAAPATFGIEAVNSSPTDSSNFLSNRNTLLLRKV